MSNVNKKALFIALGVSEEPGVSGGETRFIEIAKGWNKKGYEIHLYSTSGAVFLCEKFGLKAVHHNVKVKSKKRLGFIFRFFSSFSIPKSLKGFNNGVVVSTNEQLYDVFPGLILKLRYPGKIKWAVVVHWLPPHAWWTRKESTFINSFLFLISERVSLHLACLFADKILAVSESTKNQIKRDFFGRLFFKKVTAVKCGVNYEDTRKVSSSVSKKEYDAVFMKRLQAVKGVFDLVEIWEIVVKTIPGSKLLVIGSGVDEDKMKRKVKEKHLEKNITFAGPVFDFEDKVKKISSSKLFILPSYEENWAIVVGEAMACGVPVVAYNLKEYKSVWGNKIITVPKGDKKGFAESVIKLLNDKKSLEKLGKGGIEFVKKYNWKDISNKELGLLLDEK